MFTTPYALLAQVCWPGMLLSAALHTGSTWQQQCPLAGTPHNQKHGVLSQVYWPGMLLSAGLPVPRCVFGHGFLTSNGLKMGKSMGNVVDPKVAARCLASLHALAKASLHAPLPVPASDKEGYMSCGAMYTLGGSRTAALLCSWPHLRWSCLQSAILGLQSQYAVH